MPRKSYFDARQTLIDSFANYLDALYAEATATESLRTPSTPSPARAKTPESTAQDATAARPRRQPAPTPAASLAAQADALDGRGQQLPLAPAARHAKPVLTDEQRAANMPDAVRIARRVREVIGDNTTAFEGFKGQLALERVVVDDQLVADAWEAAGRS